jgi:hypothetical protein
MSKVRDISNLSNIIKTDASGNVSFVSGSTTLATLNTSGQLSGSSPVLSSSYALNATSASYALNATSASYALSASNATNAVTASFANAFTVANTLTAQTLVVQTITSSVDFVTGSTRFGSLSSDTMQVTGSIFVSGALGSTATGTAGLSKISGSGGTISTSGPYRIHTYTSAATSSFTSSFAGNIEILVVGGGGGGGGSYGGGGGAGGVCIIIDSQLQQTQSIQSLLELVEPILQEIQVMVEVEEVQFLVHTL